MKNEIDSFSVQRIMDEWAREADKEDNLFFKIIDKNVMVYCDRPGIWIGRAGEKINRYKEKLKGIGISEVNIIEVKNARIPDITYGMEVCTLETEGGSCNDYDRLGTIACGICGANKALAADGQECFFNEMRHMMDN